MADRLPRLHLRLRERNPDERPGRPARLNQTAMGAGADPAPIVKSQVVPTHENSIVILGAGMSGGVAARTLREEGYDGRIVLIGHEPTPPFGRPPLSKSYLRGEETLAGWMVVPEQWYEDNRVVRVHATAARVDADTHQVHLKEGGPVPFDRLLITTGGVNRTLEVPGADLPGVHQLRTVAESDAIKQDATRGARAVVVGMGFIGSEVAASLIQMGVQVTAVLPGASPLESVLGPEVGQVMAGIHRDAGVELFSSDHVVRFEGAHRIERAITRQGRRLACDFAVVSVGIRPAVDALASSGVSVDN
ncbi:MAG: hypothetical protein E6I42_06035, partial [Chloroflexi bacterium]